LKPIPEIGKAKCWIQSPQILNCSLRFVHSAGERMTRRNYTDRDEKARQVSQRLLGPRPGVVEAAGAQVRKRGSALHSEHFGIERTRAHGLSQSLNRIVRFAPHDLHEAAKEPGRGEVWIEE
jgi:hypothetical protein